MLGNLTLGGFCLHQDFQDSRIHRIKGFGGQQCGWGLEASGRNMFDTAPVAPLGLIFSGWVFLLFSFLSFFYGKTTEIRRFPCQKSGLRACCLTILNILNVLRVLRTHATPAFVDFNMNVYGVKHERLWG